MVLPFTKTVNNEDETAQLAVDFAKLVNNGQVIILIGNLGAGKTFFIKKLLASFGIRNVNSPSFAIVNEYEGKIKAYHFDFYRLNKIEELYDIGWEDYLNDTEAVLLVEWGDLLREALPVKKIEISISFMDGTKRRFDFKEYE
ncbi:tRNA (adenosine(37)-N6)-threonylcarbamoyltransferase complex ATPase subunit type 1 TsaE [bacterium BMS3Abin03]|nr:tRNA (adenosine(37)-N6)-threonylcarbamoyltransferase complex ATPase subunit type 1 TsaE [bacterium BMS3Abin03]MCG6961181.1 tRNA (adenosine(37)-N6)-threonylcarbamoyltransferase complex ATPase subunit type 1 TsaE [bacterium BMS3Abin03]